MFALECGGRPIIEPRQTTIQSTNPPETARDQTWRRLPLINEEIKSSYVIITEASVFLSIFFTVQVNLFVSVLMCLIHQESKQFDGLIKLAKFYRRHILLVYHTNIQTQSDFLDLFDVVSLFGRHHFNQIH